MAARTHERGHFMWFGNLKLVFIGPTWSDRLDAFSKITVSVMAVAFVAAAFSAEINSIPEAWTIATGGVIGFLIGAAKFA